MKIIKYNIWIMLGVILFIGCSNKDKSDVVPDKEEEDKTIEYKDYTLVWEDTFDGSALNTKNWTIEVNGDGGGNQELQYYRSENIAVGSEPQTNKNCLIITAKKEDYLNKKVTSGRLTTRDKVYFKYGKVEASIKLPKTANGLWPAFWMMGNDYGKVGWPKCGEIDILEMGNSNGIKNNTQERYFNGACHWGPTWQNNPMYAKDATSTYGLQDDFHLWTLIWDESMVKMYLDLDKFPSAAPFFEMGISNISNLNSPGHYFNKEFFILLNLAIGGHFPGISNPDNVTALANGDAKMYVDFVRVYQKKVIINKPI